ncbi:hypothetical protein [Persephonella sp.]
MGGRRQELAVFLFFLFAVVELSCAKHPEVKPLEGSERIKVYEVEDPAEKALFRMKTKMGCRIKTKEIIIPPSVKAGIYSDRVDEEIEIIARNRAVKTGGNVVILETFKKIPEIQFENKYTGKIVVLKCP